MCVESDCKREVFEQGVCRLHYRARVADGRLPRVKIRGSLCEAPGCDLRARGLRLCAKHSAQFDRRGHKEDFKFDAHLLVPPQADLICSFEDCGHRASVKNFCRSHYQQTLRFGEVTQINRGKPCPVEGCESPGGARRRLCFDHAKYCRRYGFKTDEVVQIFKDRSCYNPGCDGRGRLHLDHDHSCCPQNKMCMKCVRGWLCAMCNIALGSLRDDRRRIIGLAYYLEEGKRIAN